MGSTTKTLLTTIMILMAIVWLQYRRGVDLKTERERHKINTEALLSDMKRIQIDSTTMALDVSALRLTENEYRRLRAEDLSKIEKLGVKIRDLEATARHEMEIDIPIQTPIIDSIVIRDTTSILVKAIKMQTPHLTLEGIIENREFIGRIHLPVTLNQAVWVEYKRRWIFWRRIKAIHQTISSDNPHVEITYSEYIKIQQ